MMKVNQLLKPNVVNTTAFNSLPPKHRDVVNDFYKVVEIVYNYIDKETGE
jgi:hypothetical protein